MSEIDEGEITADTSSQNDPIARWNAVLTTQSYNFREKSKTFRSMSEQENVSFHRKVFLLTLFLCTPGKQFWQPCGKVCHKMAVVFCPTYENYFKKPKCCHGHVEGSFDNPMKKLSTEGQNLFDRSPNKKNKENFSLKLFSRQKFSSDT